MIFFQFTCHATNHSVLTSTYDLVSVSSDELNNLASSRFESYFESDAKSFVVSYQEGLSVELRGWLFRTNQQQKTKRLELHDGAIYTGTYKGEWTGQLVFTKNNESTVVLNKNILSLLRYNNSVYVATGSHHGFSSGAIYLIDLANDPTKARLLTMLPEAPNACSLDKHTIVCVSDTGLFRVADSFFQIVFWKPEWHHFAFYKPNSIVAANGGYYIGMLDGLVFVEYRPFDRFRVDFLFNKSLTTKQRKVTK